jgi:hypothetical protein
MKKENLEEAKMLVDRIEKLENAIEVCETQNGIFLEFSLNTFKPNKCGFIDPCYINDKEINLSDEQSQELLNMLKKWLKEDKERLEEL